MFSRINRNKLQYNKIIWHWIKCVKLYEISVRKWMKKIWKGRVGGFEIDHAMI